MIKLLMVAATTFCAYLAVNKFAPHLMVQGFTLAGITFAWVWCIVVAVALLCHSAVSKHAR